jgi:hypothetical protein
VAGSFHLEEQHTSLIAFPIVNFYSVPLVDGLVESLGDKPGAEYFEASFPPGKVHRGLQTDERNIGSKFIPQ